MEETWSREAMLVGWDGVEKLRRSHVAVFGLGGVGSWAAEALARAGIGTLSLIDSDTVARSNINRQLVALEDTVGEGKTEVMRSRIAQISPGTQVRTYPLFFAADSAGQIDWDGIDYIVDAIDTVSGKLALIEEAERRGIPIISSMGAGNKLDPTRFRVADIYETSVDPLARVMRRELRQRGIRSLKVVFSTEEPLPVKFAPADALPGRNPPGSISFVPPAAGFAAAGAVVRDLLSQGSA
ncbi:MAG: tRNA threonylcarbamoyladenosine dehydratase [Clostridia bacterium]|nr:tRNA threonylcarbamoyladenosine dehydratase [Clostridia bacterium]